MASWISRKRLLGAGLVVVVVGVLSSLPWTASAGSKQVLPTSPHLISQEEGQALIGRFRASAAPGAIRAHTLNRSAFDSLLAQPGANGIRIYNGRYADGKEAVVLYATGKDWQNLTHLAANLSSPCPPICPRSDTEGGDLQESAAPPAGSHLVSQEHAQGLIARFRASVAPGATRSHFLERSAFDALLAQPEAAGVRIYNAKYADGREALVLYAIDKDGQDLPHAVVNGTRPCPPYCPDSTPGDEERQ